MRLFSILPLIFGFACSVTSGQVTPPSGVVTGHVYCADTQTPCRFATVTIQSVPIAIDRTSAPASKAHSYAAPTDLTGSFEIDRVAPGEYYILARLAGYLSPYDLVANELKGESVSAQALNIALPRIAVTEGRLTVSNLTLARGASLGGTIRYDDGGLAINVPVRLFRKNTSGKWQPYINGAGDSDLAPLGFAPHTDDRGQFYEPALPPGSYIVAASLPESELLPTSILGRQSLDVKMTTGDALSIYSGNKYRVSQAIPIELKEGEDRPDADITIPTANLRSIAGAVTAAATGEKISKGSVRLLDSTDKSSLRQTEIHNGQFVFNYVPDGAYLIEIVGQTQRAAGKPPSTYIPTIVPLIVQSDMPDLSYGLSSAEK